MMPFGNIDRTLVRDVHDTPGAKELAAIRRSSETRLPYGENTWVDKLYRWLKLDMTIRPRGCPKKVEK